MTEQVKEVIKLIEELPREKQEEIILLIKDELSWEETFERTQEGLANLASEAIEEYQTGKTSDKDW